MRNIHKKSTAALALLLCVLLALCGCSRAFPEHHLETEGAAQPTEKQYNDTVQLTENDIQEMNGGKALFTYSDQGFVTTLVGKYYEGKIKTYEDAVSSLNGIASLIGLSAGS